jgi:hypothetical protein
MEREDPKRKEASRAFLSLVEKLILGHGQSYQALVAEPSATKLN